jgi:hypothetical protein
LAKKGPYNQSSTSLQKQKAIERTVKNQADKEMKKIHTSNLEEHYENQHAFLSKVEEEQKATLAECKNIESVRNIMVSGDLPIYSEIHDPISSAFMSKRDDPKPLITKNALYQSEGDSSYYTTEKKTEQRSKVVQVLSK